MDIVKVGSDRRQCEEMVPDYVWAELMAEVDGIIENPTASFHLVYVDGSARGFEVRIQRCVVLQVRRPPFVDGRWAMWAIECPDSNWANEGGAA